MEGVPFLNGGSKIYVRKVPCHFFPVGAFQGPQPAHRVQPEWNGADADRFPFLRNFAAIAWSCSRLLVFGARL